MSSHLLSDLRFLLFLASFCCTRSNLKTMCLHGEVETKWQGTWLSLNYSSASRRTAARLPETDLFARLILEGPLLPLLPAFYSSCSRYSCYYDFL